MNVRLDTALSLALNMNNTVPFSVEHFWAALHTDSSMMDCLIQNSMQQVMRVSERLESRIHRLESSKCRYGMVLFYSGRFIIFPH